MEKKFGRPSFTRERFFDQEPMEFEKLPRIDTPSGRFYRAPDGMLLPSVTTVLGSQKSEGLESWKEWQDSTFGPGSAEKVKDQAARRGDALHQMCERYLNNSENVIDGFMPLSISMFRKLVPIFDTHIDAVIAQESQVWSVNLQTAGTFDLLCVWDNKISLVDFKSASKPKDEDHILSYFMQCTAYCEMIKEIKGLVIDDFYVVVSCEFDSPQIFHKKPNDYKEITYAFFEEYAKSAPSALEDLG